MKYGLHFRSWDGLYSADRIPFFAQLAKDLGAQTLEIGPPPCVLQGDRGEVRRLGQSLRQVGIDTLLTCKYPTGAELSSEDPDEQQRGIAFLSSLIRGAAELGSYAVAGIVYSSWPHPYERDMIDKKVKRERTMRSIESMQKVMPLAEDCGVSLYAEAINRFEHYMLNTAEEGVDYCKQVGSERLKLLLDIFHMNIEEDSLEDAIQMAGPYIGHFHVSEPNRRLPHPDSRIDWESIGRALRETEYKGSVTMEPIFLFLGQTSYNSRLWRDLIADDSLEERNRMLKESLDFIKKYF